MVSIFTKLGLFSTKLSPKMNLIDSKPNFNYYLNSPTLLESSEEGDYYNVPPTIFNITEPGDYLTYSISSLRTVAGWFGYANGFFFNKTRTTTYTNGKYTTISTYLVTREWKLTYWVFLTQTNKYSPSTLTGFVWLSFGITILISIISMILGCMFDCDESLFHSSSPPPPPPPQQNSNIYNNSSNSSVVIQSNNNPDPEIPEENNNYVPPPPPQPVKPNPYENNTAVISNPYDNGPIKNPYEDNPADDWD